MDPVERFRLTSVGLGVAALAHALLTWPLRSTLALFLGGVAIAGLAELAVIQAGLLEHEMTPQVAGVPIPVLFAWPGAVYVAYRVALLAVPAGAPAAALAAVLATAWDLPTDPVGVREGVWHYPEHDLSSPRLLDVPWWNFAGWLAITFVTAMLPTLVA